MEGPGIVARRKEASKGGLVGFVSGEDEDDLILKAGDRQPPQ